MNFKHICALATLIFITFNTSCAAKKKEIFIPGPTKKEMLPIISIMGPESEAEQTKFVARSRTESKLIQLYAEEHPLPTLEEEKQRFFDEKILRKCTFGTNIDAIQSTILTGMTKERVNNLSLIDLQKYYAKIKANLKDYPRASHIFDKGFPPFSEELADNIKRTLQDTWVDQEQATLENESLETLKKNPFYLKHVKTCKEQITKLSAIPTMDAFYSFMHKEARQQVSKMSNGQIKKYYEQHINALGGQPFSINNIADIRYEIERQKFSELSHQAISAIAQKYIFKSDSPEVLAFIEELKSGKDQS